MLFRSDDHLPKEAVVTYEPQPCPEEPLSCLDPAPSTTALSPPSDEGPANTPMDPPVTTPLSQCTTAESLVFSCSAEDSAPQEERGEGSTLPQHQEEKQQPDVQLPTGPGVEPEEPENPSEMSEREARRLRCLRSFQQILREKRETRRHLASMTMSTFSEDDYNPGSVSLSETISMQS